MNKNKYKLPYYAVIFTSKSSNQQKGYKNVSSLMETLAKEQPGYLGMDSVKKDIGITISYWKNPESISQWKLNMEHLKAQDMGRLMWYEWYNVRICKVEREYDFIKD